MANTLNILSNYLSSYDNGTEDIINEYAGIINEYINNVIDSFMVNNNEYYNFLIIRGLETLKHCFKVLYLYSKNLKLTVSNCKKALCYYVEFIGQIGEDGNSYLQLTSKDAALFVYKKILFDIDLDYCKKFELTENEIDFTNIVSTLLDIYNDIMINYIYKENYGNNKEDRKKILLTILKKEKLIISKINDLDIESLKTILYFTNSVGKFIDKRDTYIDICILFVKRFNTKKIPKETIEKKLFRYDIDINSYSNNIKFIIYIFN